MPTKSACASRTMNLASIGRSRMGLATGKHRCHHTHKAQHAGNRHGQHHKEHGAERAALVKSGLPPPALRRMASPPIAIHGSSLFGRIRLCALLLSSLPVYHISARLRQEIRFCNLKIQNICAHPVLRHRRIGSARFQGARIVCQLPRLDVF